MALVVEDGSNVADANSYNTLEEFVAWAAARGIPIPAEPEAQEVLLIKAMDYIESKDDKFMGVRAYDDQVLSHPRIVSNEIRPIPAELKKAQLIYAAAAQTVELFPNVAASTANATRKTVGPITVEYSTEASRTPSIPQADALLRKLYTFGTGQLRVVRGL